MDSNHHCADFKSAASAGWATRAKMVGAPRFELGRPQGPTILQTAAAMPYLPDTRTLAEAERLERSRPVHHWTGGLANRCHTLRRRFRSGTRATIRTPCDGFGSHLLSQEHPSINWRRVKESNPHGSSPWCCFQDSFPFEATLRKSTNLVGRERFELSRTRHLFLRQACIPFHHRPIGAPTETRTR
jgi:hypothetical protein